MQGRFDEAGYVIVPGLVGRDLVDSAKQRIAELLAQARRTPEFIAGAKGTIGLPHLGAELPQIIAALRSPAITEPLEHHLGAGYALRDLSYRSPQPQFGAQTLHVDWTRPVPRGQWIVANVFIALCEIGTANGGTRLVPGSHQHVSGFRAKSPTDRHPGEVVPSLHAGDALVFSGHVLHSGTKNASAHERPLLMANFEANRSS
jgi:hypothetical protein